MTDLLRSITVCLLGSLIAISLSGCVPSYDGPPRAEISGNVSINGEPLADGVLNLVPDGHDGRSVSVPVAAGRYFIQDAGGPNFGKYKVEIYGFEEASTEEEDQFIPAKFNAETQLVLEINEPVVLQDWNLKR